MPSPAIILLLIGGGLALAASAASSKKASLKLPMADENVRPLSGTDMAKVALMASGGTPEPLYPYNYNLASSLLSKVQSGEITDEEARRRSLSIIWQVLAHGANADSDKPPGKWLLDLIKVSVAYMAHPKLAPWGPDPRARTREMIKYLLAMIQQPSCGGTYDGWAIDDLYIQRGTATCLQRQLEYALRLSTTLSGWAKDRGLILPKTGMTIPLTGTFLPDRNAVAALGSKTDQEELILRLMQLMAYLAIAKRIIWPGGAPVSPSIDIGEVFAILAGAIVGAAATIATGGAAGVAAAGVAAASAAAAAAASAESAAKPGGETGTGDAGSAVKGGYEAYQELSKL